MCVLGNIETMDILTHHYMIYMVVQKLTPNHDSHIFYVLFKSNFNFIFVPHI